MVKLLILLPLFVGVLQSQPVVIGPGSSTVFYWDRDGDGCGTGKKSSGNYGTIGAINTTTSTSGVLTVGFGDTPDADDQDASVCTTAQWKSKWGADGTDANEAKAIGNFLKARHGFINTGRVAYVSLTGSNTTGQLNSYNNPYRDLAGVQAAGFSDHQGGVIVIFGGEWTDDLNISYSGYSGNYHGAQITGMAGTVYDATKGVYIIAYPGQIVHSFYPLSGAFISPEPELLNNNFGNITIDGLVVQKNYSYGDGGSGADNIHIIVQSDHITIRNCEFLGGGKVWFGAHAWNLIIEWNVFHDMGGHGIYLSGCCSPYYGSQQSGVTTDFDYDLDDVEYSARTSIGHMRYVDISHNIIYNCGQDGFGPMHINVVIRDLTIEGNVIFGNGGTGLDICPGVSYAYIQNNLIFANGRSGITIFQDNVPDMRGHNVYIRNNTVLAWNPSVLYKGTTSDWALYSASVNQPPHDYFVENNIFGSWAGFGTHQLPINMETNSAPDSWTFKNNWFVNLDTSQPTSTVITISADAVVGNPGAAGLYTVAQLQTWSPLATNNQMGSPQLVALNNTWGLSPGNFNLRLANGSPLIGSGYSNGIADDYQKYSRIGSMDIGAYAYAGVMPVPPTIQFSALPPVWLTQVYNTSLRAYGDPTLVWTILDGSIPAGMTLNSNGTITGNPSNTGQFSFIALVTNSSGSDIMTYSITSYQAAIFNSIIRQGSKIIR